MANNAIVGLGILVIIIIVAALLLSSHPTTSTTTISASGTQSTPVLLTDPPHVPPGTSALVVSYSSVSVHTSGTNSSGWIDASGSGSINLLAAVNTSKVIGYANISANSTINLVRLNVTGATVTINGTAHNVTVPNSELLISVTGETKISPNSGVLVDVSPTVTAVFNHNATTYVMAPAARASVITNVSASAHAGVGTDVGISAEQEHEFEAGAINLTVTSATLSVVNNTTSISVTVKDNSNASAVLRTVLLQGNESVAVSGSANVNASVEGDLNGVLGGDRRANLSSEAEAAANVGVEVEAQRSVAFMVQSNDALTLALTESDFGDSGATIAAGSTATLTFSGKMAVNSGLYQITPKVGNDYTITVIGEDGASASSVVTASAG
ncbi:MAG: hypothetical protein LVQ95_01075 [Candidatus Micrarchaeales archaeon]|nr:hypothetical protein [Candidatus Micrarchaeales archaeon]